MKRSTLLVLLFGVPCLLLGTLVSAPLSNEETQCVKCHTDKDRLEALSKSLLKGEKSTEAAGTG